MCAKEGGGSTRKYSEKADKQPLLRHSNCLDGIAISTNKDNAASSMGTELHLNVQIFLWTCLWSGHS